MAGERNPSGPSPNTGSDAIKQRTTRRSTGARAAAVRSAVVIHKGANRSIPAITRCGSAKRGGCIAFGPSGQGVGRFCSDLVSDEPKSVHDIGPRRPSLRAPGGTAAQSHNVLQKRGPDTGTSSECGLADLGDAFWDHSPSPSSCASRRKTTPLAQGCRLRLRTTARSARKWSIWWRTTLGSLCLRFRLL